MDIALFIGSRYFLSKKKKSFINVISVLAVIGVMFSTMALIIFLSVFNGLEELVKSIYSSFDPDIKISSVKGKSFTLDPSQLQQIKKLNGISLITEVIEDNALAKYDDKQVIIKIKGVSNDYYKFHNMKNFLVEGKANFIDRQGYKYAIIGRGVQYKLGINMENKFYHIQFWYPKNIQKILNPERAFNSANLIPGGVFSLEKQYDDNYVFVPLDFAASLMEYKDKLTSLEINLKHPKSVNEIQEKLRSILGSKFNVLTIDEQHISMLRAMKIEKLFLYFAFIVIIGISSLNIFFTITMLAIEKAKDIKVLLKLGAAKDIIQKIFLYNGFLIATIGTVSGLLLGFAICYLQQKFGFVSMGTETSLINTYPVKMKPIDFITTGCIMMIITFLISYFPSKKASETEARS